MAQSIKTVSSLTRTVSSTSVRSISNDETVSPHPLRAAPVLPQSESTSIKHIKAGSCVQVSVSEIPKRKPVLIPPNPTTTIITAAPYHDSPFAEKGAGATSANSPWRSLTSKFKRPFMKSTSVAASPSRPPTPPTPLITTAAQTNDLKPKLPFQSNKKKQRVFLIVGGVVLLHLILVIGLTVGLSGRNKSSNINHHSSVDLPLPNNHGGPYMGDLTYYDPGLGACGIESSAGEPVCAVSHYLYDAVSVGPNPNANPLCGKKLRLRRAGRSVDVTVVDRCVGCQPNDIDVSISVFTQLALEEQGRVDVQWAWLEDTPLPRTPPRTPG
ncbi:riboflavin aldehyde-forming enzyme [Histoplasma capsulatum G186AR]|uniref:Riboflavin aldehyde-forming enzyme n=2 Tax=Ajellomyces capsulatus TaxID=5037 RepID=C0NQC9_AJECG|nr:riboflavin aldehyde-forming enzyme [Histoplasma capsulatum G186AR]EEH06401.1 riboflavin aldehyde-forming enzyme [Histoplasma capsulatum G186AR]KAG5293139.1 riboflavin aldehyde-forming enzyme [Histoplasma capsulatum]QSS74590.1 riboflavin aldehyde-forming enzyme [Histoplasma capsulatum G186AR]